MKTTKESLTKQIELLTNQIAEQKRGNAALASKLEKIVSDNATTVRRLSDCLAEAQRIYIPVHNDAMMQRQEVSRIRSQVLKLHAEMIAIFVTTAPDRPLPPLSSVPKSGVLRKPSIADVRQQDDD